MYRKPVIMRTDDLAEGVYAASGCYTATAYIHQWPETGRGDYRIQVNGHHHGDHTNNKQRLTISFNIPVQFVSSSGGVLITGNNTKTLVIEYSYHQNQNEDLGLGDLVVTADPKLEITSCKITD